MLRAPPEVSVRQILFVGLVLPALLAACGPTCQSTCQKLYSEQQCNLQRPGKSNAELYGDCVNYCETALKEPGSLNGYDPYSRGGTSNSVTLDNENQAAAWMYCVEQQACERLDYRSGQGGFCQPVW